MTGGKRTRADLDTLRGILEPLGLWNADGIGRRARARLCPDCRSYLLAGLDDDRAAAPARVDPTPLNVLGEAMALLAGIRTYSLTYIGGRFEIDYRDEYRIKGRPAGTVLNQDVLAEHRCNRTIPAEHVAKSSAVTPPRKETMHNDNPPF